MVTHLSKYIKRSLELHDDCLKDTVAYRKREIEREVACFANTQGCNLIFDKVVVVSTSSALLVEHPTSVLC